MFKRWLTFLFLGLVVGGSLVAGSATAELEAETAKTPRFSYFYKGKLVTMAPSERLVAVEASPNGAAIAASGGLRRDPVSDRAVIQSAGLAVFRTPASGKKGAPALHATAVLDALERRGDTAAQPVFEQGAALMVPSNQVIVGFKQRTGYEQARAFLNRHADRLALRSLQPHRENTYLVTIRRATGGRIFQVSRALSRAAAVAFAEPNMLVVNQEAGAAPDVQVPLVPGPKAPGAWKYAGPLKGSGTSFYPVETQAAVSWTTLLSEGFEGTLSAGWDMLWGQAAPEAYPAIQTFRKQAGTKAIYMTGGGTQGVAAPGPYPANALSALQTPLLNFAAYEEVYAEFWFWAKYEDPANGTIFDGGIFRIVHPSSGAFQDLNNLLVGYTGDLTVDPTTKSGWRRCFVRIPPGWRANGVQFQFLFFSDSGVQTEGLYIDNLRVVGTADVDTESLGTDTYGARLYEHKNSGQLAALGTDSTDMNVPEALAAQAVSTNVVVAIIDDGVDLAHPDLNLVTGYNGATGAVGGGPADTNSNHGTACAGNAGAIRNNGIGVMGTAPGVKIMPIQHGGQTASMANSIDLAVQHGANVLSNSWGWVGAPSQDIENAIAAALAANRSVVFAAGNGPDRPPFTYEVAFPGHLTSTYNIITVGASSQTDEHKSASSSDGIFSWGSSYVGPGPDVMAPGPWSYTTDRRGALGYNTDAAATGVHADYEYKFGGTSSSTPKVAGVVALMLSKNPNLTPAQVKSILKSTAKDIETAGVDDKTGSGRVDALAAVNASGSNTFSISGTVTLNGAGLSGVVMSAGGKSATTATNGTYTITGVAAGTHTLTPTKSGHVFTPATRSVTVGPNKTGQNFTATQVFTISGTVTLNGAGLVGVVMSAGGKTATTAANGTYTIQGVPAGTHTLTPTKSGHTFTPTTRSVTVGPNKTAQNFTATVSSGFSVSGTIWAAGGTPLGSVTVSGGGKTTTTAANGNYTLTGVPSGTHVITPTRAGYVFTPVNRSVAVTANKTGINYTAVQTFTISGTVKRANGTAISGVEVIAGGQKAVTSATGAYSITGVPAGTYLVVPVKAGSAFTPLYRAVTVGPSKTGQNFTGSP